LLQQEIGQAGRISLPPNTYTMVDTWAADPDPNADRVVTLSVRDVDGNPVALLPGLFAGEKLVIDNGEFEETVTVTVVTPNNNQVTARFVKPHPVTGAKVGVAGGFHAGIVPNNTANGSTATKLKLFGDVNGTGNMVYVEYTCDVNAGNLYRRSMPFTAAAKPGVTPDLTLLNHIKANPDNAPCFTYQTKNANGLTFVTDVAITLTVETPDPDPITGLVQEQTKALLNVSPRNVFNVWQLASAQLNQRVQPTPQTVTLLLPQP
jgi:hypothetical protein